MVDFEGQKLAEQIFYVVIVVFGALGWVVGYMQQSFTVVFQMWLVGVVLSVIVCVPDWPFYNKHPVKWLDSVQERRPPSTKAD